MVKERWEMLELQGKCVTVCTTLQMANGSKSCTMRLSSSLLGYIPQRCQNPPPPRSVEASEPLGGHSMELA